MQTSREKKFSKKRKRKSVIIFSPEFEIKKEKNWREKTKRGKIENRKRGDFLMQIQFKIFNLIPLLCFRIDFL